MYKQVIPILILIYGTRLQKSYALYSFLSRVVISSRKVTLTGLMEVLHLLPNYFSLLKLKFLFFPLVLLRYDLVDLTRQALAKYANQLFLKVVDTYQLGDLRLVTQLSQKFLGLVEDVDTLLACHDGFLLGPWLESAKELAQNEEQKKQVKLILQNS